MPIRAKTWRIAPFILWMAAFALGGCTSGTGNSSLSFVDAQGNHPAGWISTHPTFALPDGSPCASCHGADLHGGISQVSCFSASLNGQACHASGPAFHPANWLTTHPPAALAYVPPCADCHGADLNGGGASVSCFSASRTRGGVTVNCHSGGPRPSDHKPAPDMTWFNAHQGAAAALRPTFTGCNAIVCHGPTVHAEAPAIGPSCFLANFDGFVPACHSGGPPSVDIAHNPGPSTWYVGHRSAAVADNTSCASASCHGATWRADPPTSTGPSCFSASWGTFACHANGPGSVHAVPFFDNVHFQATQTSFTNSCSTCHAITGTSPFTGAPLCTVCHTGGSPFTLTGCTSCHGSPPTGGAGAAYPNIAGAHALHIGLNGTGTPVSCSTCHNGLGSNTLNHYNRANARTGFDALHVPPGDAAFLSTYNAKTGASSFDNTTALSCSNVSCHGGQATPNWRSGTLNATQCTSCHALGTAQFNSYNSGEHGLSDHVSRGCTSCHDTAKLAPGHFTNLSTAAFEQLPSATLLTAIQFTGTTCNPQAGGITGCHGQKNW